MESSLHIMDNITIVFSFITMIVVFVNLGINLSKRYKENQKINIYFNIHNKNCYLLNLDIARKEVTRAEIQGILSAFQKKPSQRYSIAYLSEISFLDDIYKIQNNSLDSLIIKLTDKEMNGEAKGEKPHDGFDTTKMKEVACNM